ncbi:MAG: nitroreductase family protein, partial [Thermomicrobiales bacterium]
VYPDPARQTAERIMAIQSIGAAIQNLLLSIHAAGLDAGWMCAPLFCPDIVRDSLGLATTLHPHALIPVGHAAKDPVRRERMPVDTLIAAWL